MKIPDDVREDIPLTKKLIYFDSAGTSLTPKPIVEAMDDYYLNYRGNVHRGLHQLSLKASRAYEGAHEKTARFIGAKYSEVFFLKNATEALNQIAFGIPHKGDVVVTTELEHNSNLLPWLRLRKDCEIRIVKITKEGGLDMDDLEEKISGAKIFSVTHTSNTLGNIMPLQEIRRLTEKEGVLLCIDAAQAVGHTRVDVNGLGCDFLAFSAHKGPMGPTGVGILYAREEYHDQMEPLLLGGGMVEDVSLDDYRKTPPPERYEAGTPNIAGAIGLGAAIDYLEKIGIENIKSYEEKLTSYTLKRLGEIENLTLYGPRENRAAVVSFNIKGLSSHDVAIMLDEKNICIRSGHHCAITPLRALGIEETARASYHCYNTIGEIDTMADLLEELAGSVQ